MFNKMKKCVSIGMIAVLTMGLTAGCGSTGSTASASGSGKKILYTVCNTDDTFRAKLSNALVSSGTEQGVTVDMQLCGSDIQDQVTMVSEAKANGYDAVIVRLTDASTALQMEDAAGDLPLVFVNNQPDDNRLSDSEYVYVGSDEEQAGTYQTEYVLDKLGHPSSLNVIILEGEQGHSGTIGRTNAVKKTLKSEGVSANYVFVDYCNWSDTEAEHKLEMFFRTNQPYDCIIANNDTMALGAANALKAKGIDPGSIPICGVDATSDGCASIAAGEMGYTVLQDADNQAKAAVEAAIIMAGGGSISSIDGASEDGKYIWVPYVPVDSSNVSQYQ